MNYNRQIVDRTVQYSGANAMPNGQSKSGAGHSGGGGRPLRQMILDLDSSITPTHTDARARIQTNRPDNFSAPREGGIAADLITAGPPDQAARRSLVDHVEQLVRTVSVKFLEDFVFVQC